MTTKRVLPAAFVGFCCVLLAHRAVSQPRSEGVGPRAAEAQEDVGWGADPITAFLTAPFPPADGFDYPVGAMVVLLP